MSAVYQGQSNVTPIKEAQIHGVVYTRLLQRKNAGHWIRGVRVYDVFAGDGLNLVDGELVWGSPVEILDAIVASRIQQYKPVIFTATDKRNQSIETLRARLDGIAAETDEHFLPEIRCEARDASHQIRLIARDLSWDKRIHAIVVVDPNGPGVLPYDELVDLAKSYSGQCDIFINISETAMCRILACAITKDKNWWSGMRGFKDVVFNILRHYKEGWFRDVISGDRQKWRFMAFWSYAPPRHDWGRQGLLAIKSREDIERILTCNCNATSGDSRDRELFA